jgi:hypothetical protein
MRWRSTSVIEGHRKDKSARTQLRFIAWRINKSHPKTPSMCQRKFERAMRNREVNCAFAMNFCAMQSY